MLIQLAFISLSIVVGCILGLIYGLLFLNQKKRALFDTDKSTNFFSFWLHQLLYASLRIGGMTLIILYLLPLPKIHFIMVMISFLIIFWIVITQHKDNCHV